MNYNNFASRISTPRVIPISHPQPVRETGKKPRKPARRRLSNPTALLIITLALSAGAFATDIPAPYPEAPHAFISATEVPSFGKAKLSPITQTFLGIGLAVALIQARLLLTRRELEC